MKLFVLKPILALHLNIFKTAITKYWIANDKQVVSR